MRMEMITLMMSGREVREEGDRYLRRGVSNAPVNKNKNKAR